MSLDPAAIGEIEQKVDALKARADGFFDRTPKIKPPRLTAEQKLANTEKGIKNAISTALGKPPNPRCVSNAGCGAAEVQKAKRFARSEWADFFSIYPTGNGFTVILSWNNPNMTPATYQF